MSWRGGVLRALRRRVCLRPLREPLDVARATRLRPLPVYVRVVRVTAGGDRGSVIDSYLYKVC